MKIKLSRNRVTKTLSVLSLIFLLVAAGLEYSSNKTNEKLNDSRGSLDAHNRYINEFIDYTTGMNYLIGVYDILIAINKSKDFNLDEQINQRGEEIKQYKLTLLRRLENATHSPHMDIPIGVYNEGVVLVYEKELVTKHKAMGEYTAKEIYKLEKLKSSKESWRNILFFFGLIMQILSEIFRK